MRAPWLLRFGTTLLFTVAWIAGSSALAADPHSETIRDQARRILDATGVTGGLVVLIGCGDGRLAADLYAGEGFLVQSLDTNAASVEAARKYIQSLGLYGPVSVEQRDGKRLPYADNLVNLIVVDDLGQVPMAEVLRVLVPNGVAWIGGTKTVKAATGRHR